MTFRVFGTRFRLTLWGEASGDPVRVCATAPKRPTVYLTKPHSTSRGEESIGMTPEQARAVATLLNEAADWCDAKSGDPHGA